MIIQEYFQSTFLSSHLKHCKYKHNSILLTFTNNLKTEKVVFHFMLFQQRVYFFLSPKAKRDFCFSGWR